MKQRRSGRLETALVAAVVATAPSATRNDVCRRDDHPRTERVAIAAMRQLVRIVKSLRNPATLHLCGSGGVIVFLGQSRLSAAPIIEPWVPMSCQVARACAWA